MEKRITHKVNDYILNIKKSLLEENTKEDLLKRIQSIEPIQFEKGDFTKRNRAKNTIPLNDRCLARRANSEQCTRRKNKGCDYCGTHAKGVPHGIITNDTEIKYKKQDVWAEDINGIIYYIDQQHNVYKTEDILNNIINPRIIYKWKMNHETYVLIPV
jgi:hypothetical protein